jgi:1,4-alpha-glucan branching enzyme
MTYLADRFSEAQGVLLRALNQAAREILLMQHSDWTFMIKNGTSAEYAAKRLRTHIERFHLLYQSIISNEISEERLSEIEERDRIFKDIDYRVYANKK